MPICNLLLAEEVRFVHVNILRTVLASESVTQLSVKIFRE